MGDARYLHTRPTTEHHFPRFVDISGLFPTGIGGFQAANRGPATRSTPYRRGQQVQQQASSTKIRDPATGRQAKPRQSWQKPVGRRHSDQMTCTNFGESEDFVIEASGWTINQRFAGPRRALTQAQPPKSTPGQKPLKRLQTSAEQSSLQNPPQNDRRETDPKASPESPAPGSAPRYQPFPILNEENAKKPFSRAVNDTGDRIGPWHPRAGCRRKSLHSNDLRSITLIRNRPLQLLCQ